METDFDLAVHLIYGSVGYLISTQEVPTQLLLSAGFGLVVLWAGLAMTRLVEDLFARSAVFGWIGADPRKFDSVRTPGATSLLDPEPGAGERDRRRRALLSQAFALVCLSATVLCVMVLVVLLATLLPSHRASRVSPMEALRDDFTETVLWKPVVVLPVVPLLGVEWTF